MLKGEHDGYFLFIRVDSRHAREIRHEEKTGSMRLLYLSCHAVLEFDELTIFNELGIEFYSLGAYSNPMEPSDNIRPPLGIEPNAKWISMQCSIENVPRDFINEFDVVMVMHRPDWIEKNWGKIRGKVVIWRTIGQSSPYAEKLVGKFRQEGLKIVRYSPKERTIKGFAGEDALIRFYKDPEEFGHWRGTDKSILSVCQDLKKRPMQNNFHFYQKATSGFPKKLFGRGNEGIAHSGGAISYEKMKTEMRNCRVYFSCGTKPAPYTLNFIEAWMTGIPVVAVGRRRGNPFYLRGSLDPFRKDLYEVPDFLSDGSGFCSDNISELRNYVGKLLEDYEFARTVGEGGRKKAIELFGKDHIKNEWKNFLRGF
jgi:hypothetical protein